MAEDDDEWEDWIEARSEAFVLNRAKSCIGKRVFVYQLSVPVARSLFDRLSGSLSFPLGEKYPFYQFDSPGRYVITGLLGDCELRLVPRLAASAHDVCREAEAGFEAFCRPD